MVTDKGERSVKTVTIETIYFDNKFQRLKGSKLLFGKTISSCTFNFCKSSHSYCLCVIQNGYVDKRLVIFRDH